MAIIDYQHYVDGYWYTVHEKDFNPCGLNSRIWMYTEDLDKNKIKKINIILEKLAKK